MGLAVLRLLVPAIIVGDDVDDRGLRRGGAGSQQQRQQQQRQRHLQVDGLFATSGPQGPRYYFRGAALLFLYVELLLI